MKKRHYKFADYGANNRVFTNIPIIPVYYRKTIKLELGQHYNFCNYHTNIFDSDQVQAMQSPADLMVRCKSILIALFKAYVRFFSLEWI